MQKNYQKLSNTLIDKTVEIVSIDMSNNKLQFRIYEMGFTPGVKISILQKTPYGILIEKSYSTYAIDLKTCKNIIVKEIND